MKRGALQTHPLAAAVVTDAAQFIQDHKFLAVGLAIILALTIHKTIDAFISLMSRWLAGRADNVVKNDHHLKIRRVETFLSVTAAITRSLLVALVLFIMWKLLIPAAPTGTPLAIVGASAVFIVLAGATVGPLLRDVTSGTAMITEQWFNIGDHVMIDPFINLSGVVERMTLRSTKLRSLNGEIIWVHNQHIQAARVTPRGVRTIAVDTFVNDPDRGQKIINKVITTLPVGPTKVASPLVIDEVEQLGELLWRVTAVGQTVPGREWLIEDFALQAIKQSDEAAKIPTIAYGPIVRYADATAERRFKRSVRAKKRPANKS
jgi:hypothetical protein